MTFRPIFRDQLIYQVCDPVILRDEPASELIWADASNAHRVLDFRSGPVSELFEKFVYSDGRTGVFALIENRVVGHAWMTSALHRSTMVNGYFSLDPGQALVHHCNVATQFRGQGIFALMVRALFDRALASHVSLFIDTEFRNDSSRRGIEAMGCTYIGRGRYLQLGGRLIASRLTITSAS